jgi:hypothetical protein
MPNNRIEKNIYNILLEKKPDAPEAMTAAASPATATATMSTTTTTSNSAIAVALLGMTYGRER